MILSLALFGCSTIPKPLVIKHDGTQAGGAPAAGGQDTGKTAAEKAGEARPGAAGGNPPGPGAAVEAGQAGGISDAERERIEKIAAGITAELMKGLREQVKKEVREELVAEMIENEKEQIKAGVAEEIKKIRETMAEERRGEAKEERKIEPAAAPVQAAQSLASRIRFGGDIRLRYEADRFDKKNDNQLGVPSNPGTLMNTTMDQDRYKYRVRVGAAMEVNDQVEAVLSLSTGNTSTPVSTNAIIGDFMNKDSALFDLAYIKWRPREYLTIWGGRMPNPWFSTDLLWAKDLNFEGVAFTLKKPVDEASVPFLTAGAFPLQQNDFTQHSKWLFAGQAGLEKKSKDGIGYKAGVAYYHYENITGVPNETTTPNATDWSVPLFQQKGNTLFKVFESVLNTNAFKMALASKFKELNFTGALDVGFWDPVHVVLLGDYVRNIGFKKSEVAGLTGLANPPRETQGYQMGVAVGYPATVEPGQWKAYLYYKRVGADAVVDAFTDSDFHLGGTNAKGWILGADYALLKNFWVTLKWLSANEVSGPPLAIDVLQADLSARF